MNPSNRGQVLRVSVSCVFILVIYSVLCFRKIKFLDFAWFGGDTWVYQSEGVNFAKGYGKRLGAIENFEEYKFGSGFEVEEKKNSVFYNSFIEYGKNGGILSFFSTPGYSFFVGIVYKIFGIKPVVLKNIQLLFFIVIASFLPLLGYLYWEKIGYISGLLSGLLFIRHYIRPISEQFLLPGITYPDQILTEPLATFLIFVFMLAVAFWEKKKSILQSLFLGVLAGTLTLVKGILLFVPFLFVCWFLWLIIKGQIKINILIGLIVGILLVTVPWSVYASKKANTFILNSTQDDRAILATNNEFSLDGSWHPEGYIRQDSFYNRPEIVNLPTWQKVIRFYLSHKYMIPKIFFNKIDLAFSYFAFFKVCSVLLIFRFIVKLLLILSVKKKVDLKIARWIWFLSLCAAIFGLYKHFRIYYYNFNLVYSPFFFPPLLISLVIFFYLLNIIISKKIPTFGLPTAFIVFFVNYLMMTISTLGMMRLIQVLDFIFILSGFYLLISTGLFSIKLIFIKKINAGP